MITYKIIKIEIHLGETFPFLGDGDSSSSMSALFNSLREFKDFKNNPTRAGLLHGALHGIRRKVLVLVPVSTSPTHRWAILKLLLQLIWSSKAIGAVVTGALLSLLSFFAEQPGALLRALINDPDIEVHPVDIVVEKDGTIKFSSRGLNMEEQENRYRAIADSGPEGSNTANPFLDEQIMNDEIRTTDEFQMAVNSVIMQVWILLTKAVTAPDTARESDNRRWLKYVQQKRVSNQYRLKNIWLDITRDQIARDISVRRYMVSILVEINRASGPKNRILQMIADIGNYIAENGLAGFFLTIKYGIETRYPALALTEFQGDLNTIISLMKLYKEQGEAAPYMVILEESVQTKFGPGEYSLLWSFAMGVGSALDKQMGNLNFNRNFLEPNYFRLGQEMVMKMEGSVDSKMADDMGLTPEQIARLRSIVKEEAPTSQNYTPRARVSGYTSMLDEPETKGESTDDDDDQPSTSAAVPKPTKPPRAAAKSTGESIDFQNRIKKITQEMRNRFQERKETPESAREERPINIPAAHGNDIDVINSV